MASMSKSRRAVSRASVVPAPRVGFAFPFKALVLEWPADAVAAEVAFFFVAMLPFPLPLATN